MTRCLSCGISLHLLNMSRSSCLLSLRRMKGHQVSKVFFRQASTSPSDYCLKLVKQRDYEHYVCSLLLPAPELVSSALSIRAFNVEMSSVRDGVKERQLGLMRLQFWRQVVKALFHEAPENVPNQPIAKALAQCVDSEQRCSGTIAKCTGNEEHFLRLIASREIMMDERPFDSVTEAERYASDAFASINHLLLASLLPNERSDGKNAMHVAEAIGIAQGLSAMIRGVPWVANKRRQVILPSDLMLRANLSAESVIRKGEKSEALRQVIQPLAKRISEHLDKARLRSKLLSREEKCLFLPIVVVDGFLDKLHRAEYNVFDPKLHRGQSDGLLPFKLWWHRFRKQL